MRGALKNVDDDARQGTETGGDGRRRTTDNDKSQELALSIRTR